MHAMSPTDQPRPLADANLARVRDVLEPLGREQKARLHQLIRDGHLDNQTLGPHVASLLLEMLNGRRTEHARRLWTGWFDPILLRDDISIRAETRLPASMHIIDAGAWWFALSQHMEHNVARIQRAITKQAREKPLDEIFASPAALRIAEDLRKESLAIIAAVKPKATERAKFLADANMQRKSMLASRNCRATPPLTAADIDTLEFLLTVAPAWRDLAKPAPATGLGTLTDYVLTAAEERRSGAEGAMLLVVAHLHAKRNPAAALEIHHTFPQTLIRDSIVAHFQLAAQIAREWIEEHYLNRAPTRTPPNSGDIEVMTDQVFAWYDALHALGIDESDRHLAGIRDAFGRFINAVELELVPSLGQRLMTMTRFSSPEPLLERIRYVASFKARLKPRGFATAIKPWQPSIAQHLSGLFRDLTGTGQPADLPRLGKLAELMELIGHPLEVTALDGSLIRIVEEALAQRQRFSDEESGLIDRLLTTASDERRRCRWWVSPEVMNLLKTADRTGWYRRAGT